MKITALNRQFSASDGSAVQTASLNFMCFVNTKKNYNFAHRI